MRSEHKHLLVSAGAAWAVGLLLLMGRYAAGADSGAVPNVTAPAETNAYAEVLLRGPVHEAFATQVDANLSAGAIVPKQPPAAIEEIPPAYRPAGDDVVWIPGYWAWDDEPKDFVWVSGVWRRCPPSHRWVPGYWARAEGGWRWVSGAWLAADITAMRYLPYPQQLSLERGSSSRPPSSNLSWIPGVWLYQEGRYQWRPGYWAEGRPDWTWIPDHYAWTPRGAVFVGGYWDYRLTDRGLLFAPVRFRAGAQVGARFSPREVVDVQNVMLHLFVAPAWHHYYFGDYYGQQYAAAGIYPWFEFRSAARGFDPLLTYYVWRDALAGIDLVARLAAWHDFYLGHVDLRPPRTLATLDVFAKRQKGNVNAQLAMLGRPLSNVVAATAATAAPLVHLTESQVGSVLGVAGQLHALTEQRLGIESLTSDVAGRKGVAGGVAGTANNLLQLPRIENPLATPGVGLPGVRLPGVGTPEVGVPRVGVPGITTPTLPAPSIGVPGVQLPGVDIGGRGGTDVEGSGGGGGLLGNGGLLGGRSDDSDAEGDDD